MTEDGVDVDDLLPPPEEFPPGDQKLLQSYIEFVSHVLNLGNGEKVKEFRFNGTSRRCNITDYMIERLSRKEIIGVAESLMKARVDYLRDISNGYESLEGNVSLDFAINIIRTIISENMEFIEWEYENFSSANKWAIPRDRKAGDNPNANIISEKIIDSLDKFGSHDWLFSHRLFSQDPMHWWERHSRVYRQRIILGKAVKKPENWDYQKFQAERKKRAEELTMVEENKPSSQEMICSFLATLKKNNRYREIRIRYTNDMLDFVVPDLKALIDEVRSMVMERQMRSNYEQLWTYVFESINLNNVKYIYALFKKGPEALVRFEDENMHQSNSDWNQAGKLEYFFKFFCKTIHYETSTPVPMTERRNPLVVQSGLDFMNNFINGTLNPGSGSSGPSFSSRPLTEEDLYPSKTHAADGGSKEESAEKENKESVSKKEASEDITNTEPVENGKVESIGKENTVKNETKPNLGKQKPVVENQPKRNSTGSKGKKESTKSGRKETSGKNEPKKKVADNSKSKRTAWSIVENTLPVNESVSTTSFPPLLPSPKPVAKPKVATEVTKEVTIIKRAEEIESVTLTAKPTLSYAKVVKKTNGDSEEVNKAPNIIESSAEKTETKSIPFNEAEKDHQRDDDDGSEWTQVVSKTNENRSQKKKQNGQKTLQQPVVPSTVSQKKVLTSLDSKDTDETSSNSSSSLDIKSQDGNSTKLGNGKTSQPTTTNGVSKKSESEASFESSKKNGKSAWGLPTDIKKDDVKSESTVLQVEEQKPSMLTQTAIKKAKKAAAAQRKLESMPPPSTEAKPKTIEKLVMVADDKSVTEAELDVVIKEKSKKSAIPKTNNKKKGASSSQTKMDSSSSNAGPLSTRNLTTVEAHITDRTATMILEKALAAALEKTAVPSSSSNIQRSAEHVGTPIVHDYRPGVRRESDENLASEDALVINEANGNKNPQLADRVVPLANPEDPIEEVASNPETNEMFRKLKLFNDHRQQLAKTPGSRKKSFAPRRERFELAYLFRLRLAKGLYHIYDSDAVVEAATNREDSTTRLMIAFLKEPIENTNSLRGQNLDHIREFDGTDEEKVMAGLRFLDLRLAELAPESEFRQRYQLILDKLQAVVKEQETYYRLLAPHCTFKL